MDDFVLTRLFLKRLGLRALANRNFPCLQADCTLDDAVLFFRKTGILFVVIIDEAKQLLGVLRGIDLLEPLRINFVVLTPVMDLAREQQLTIAEDDAADFSLDIILDQGVQEVLIVDQDRKFLGAIILNDLFKPVWNEIAKLDRIFGKVLESVYNGVLVINVLGKIVFLNQTAEELFGCQAEDVLGKHIYSILPESELPSVARTGKPKLSCRQRVGDRLVVTNRTPVIINNKIIGAVAVFQDITDLENVSEELTNTKKIKDALEAVVETPYEDLVVVDENARIVMMNKFYLDGLGLSLEDVLGKHILEITPQSQLPETIRTGVARIGDLWKIGDRELVVMRVPIRKDGKIVGAIGKSIFQDMSFAMVFAKKIMRLESDLDYYREELCKVHSSEYTFDHIIGESYAIKAAKIIAGQASRTSSNVLITGGSGTGKEVFAQAIHNASVRKKGPFIKINCAAIPENLLESELFGYEEGAFTGARKGGKPGKFEIANNGTIFLDEIGDMSLTMQAKLLRVIQEREIERVGGTESIKINVRIIAATNRDLQQMVDDNQFRSDLFYRLNVVVLELPLLKERLEDIEPLTDYLIKRLNHNMGTAVSGVAPETMQILQKHSWPGNIRELENVLERAMNISDDYIIYPEHLPIQLRRAVGDDITEPELKTLGQVLSEAEREAIISALHAAKGNRVQASKALGIHRSILYKKMTKHKIAEEVNEKYLQN